MHTQSYSLHACVYAYTVSSVDVTINMLSSRQGTFTVTCTASGGTVASSSLTGPGEDLELLPVGSIGRTGQNTYSDTSGTLSRRSNGDTYLCTAGADLSSPHLSGSTVLRGIMQIMCTCVRAHNGTEVLDSTLLSVSHSFLLLLCSPVATDPTIMLLVQVSVTAVRVEWSQP